MFAPDAPASWEIQLFSQRDHPDLTREVQRLRYDVYHGDLGLDTPDMDHTLGLDIEDHDPLCDCLVVRHAGSLVGALRLQASGPFYAEKEFVLLGESWSREPFVEGARFAVQPSYREYGVALKLFAAFRDYCRERGIDKLVSVSIVPDRDQRPARALSILRWLRERVAFDLDRGQPARGYECDVDLADIEAASPLDAVTLPPMLQMLAHRRTTLCSPPAYCRRFHTWNFLLVTALRRTT